MKKSGGSSFLRAFFVGLAWLLLLLLPGCAQAQNLVANFENQIAATNLGPHQFLQQQEQQGAIIVQALTAAPGVTASIFAAPAESVVVITNSLTEVQTSRSGSTLNNSPVEEAVSLVKSRWTVVCATGGFVILGGGFLLAGFLLESHKTRKELYEAENEEDNVSIRAEDIDESASTTRGGPPRARVRRPWLKSWRNVNMYQTPVEVNDAISSSMETDTSPEQTADEENGLARSPNSRLSRRDILMTRLLESPLYGDNALSDGQEDSEIARWASDSFSDHQIES